MKLYQVRTTVDEFADHRNVTFAWFREDRTAKPRPYGELIEDYEACENKIYSEDAIDEMFTLDEAERLAEYLATYGETEIKQVELPVSNGTFPLTTMAIGSCGPDHYMLHKMQGYPLPFRVSGYFDLRQHTEA
jgi:hypothetical protein